MSTKETVDHHANDKNVNTKEIPELKRNVLIFQMKNVPAYFHSDTLIDSDLQRLLSLWTKFAPLDFCRKLFEDVDE